MGNKFAVLTAAGDLRGFIDDTIMKPPAGAVALTDAQWADWVANQGTRQWVNGALVVYTAPEPPAPAPTTRYVPLATIRDRVTAVGKWTMFAQALDALPSDKRWHLLTLQDGVASDDADAVALLTAVDCDPTVILAP